MTGNEFFLCTLATAEVHKHFEKVPKSHWHFGTSSMKDLRTKETSNLSAPSLFCRLCGSRFSEAQIIAQIISNCKEYNPLR